MAWIIYPTSPFFRVIELLSAFRPTCLLSDMISHALSYRL